MTVATRHVLVLLLLPTTLGFAAIVPAWAETIIPAAPQDVRNDNPSMHILQRAAIDFQRVCSEIQDYTCLVVRRERIRGVLGSYQFIQAKVRHHRETDAGVVPFSVYLKFLAPQKIKGREVLYVEGENDGKLVVSTGRSFLPMTLTLKPDGDLAMDENRHPITQFGFENFGQRILDLAPMAIAPDQATVKYLKNTKVDGRRCTGIVVRRTQRDDKFRFQRVIICFDHEFQIPIHYAAYGWPKQDGDDPPLLEQYTFRNIKLNPGLSDSDFRRDNPEYRFDVK